MRRRKWSHSQPCASRRSRRTRTRRRAQYRTVSERLNNNRQRSRKCKTWYNCLSKKGLMLERKRNFHWRTFRCSWYERILRYNVFKYFNYVLLYNITLKIIVKCIDIILIRIIRIHKYTLNITWENICVAKNMHTVGIEPTRTSVHRSLNPTP